MARVLATLGVEDSYAGALGYYICVAVGAFLGYFIIDRMRRRTLLFGGFVAGAVLLMPLAFIPNLDPLLSVGLFTLFALVIVAIGNVVYVYPAELFTTELRGSGVGLAVAASRLGSAVTTFLMPIVVGTYGIATALGACVALLVAGCARRFRLGPGNVQPGARRQLRSA
ncbi:MFS transporter [Saccharopolyspora sp. NPDC050389]|uniref:MFS transporter n=1 Tax=Saccharopolyspora sp. NPDC050389 TaxID=3155516 RepID=UPI0033FAF6E2